MATVSGFTALSRVLGFLRDIFMARYLGTGRAADAFFAAFRFPNMFRRIFGEGAFNAAFVPLFAREMEEKDKEDAVKFANNAFSFMVLVLGALTLMAIPLMFWILSAVVPGFKASEKSPHYAPGAVAEEFRFKVNVRGAKEIFFVLEGDASLVAIGEAKLSAGRRDGWMEKLGVALGGEREVPEDAMMLDMAGNAERQAQLGAGGVKEISFKLPKKHDFRELTGVIRTNSGEGAGARVKIYRNHPGTTP
jgi:hypothetical protein